MGKFALLSIHPEHVTNILAGKKVFEYRKVIPRQGVSHLVLYCTAPVKRIIAVAEVLGRVVGSPSYVWNATSYGSGISRQFFRDYFSGQRSASAFSLGNVYELTTPIALSELTGQKSPPQSFYYLEDADIGLIMQRQPEVPSVSPSMVFVGGVHGVGKSTLCKRSFSPIGYRCVTASSLITAGGQRTNKEKLVNDAVDNQAVLLEQLRTAKKQYCRLLLDGHFTLINSQGQIEPIEPEIFRTMKLNQLILIKGCSDEISSRLKERDGKKWTSSFLKKFQSEEEAHARYISEEIDIPLQVFDNTVGFAKLARSVHQR